MPPLGFLISLLGTLFGHIGSGLVSAFGNSVLTPIVNTIQNGQNAGRDVAVSTLSAEVAANNAKALIAPQFKGLIYLISLPAALHWGAIMADSFPWPGHVVGSWRIGALPDTYATIEGIVLTAPFISSPISTLAKAGAAALIKR